MDSKKYKALLAKHKRQNEAVLAKYHGTYHLSKVPTDQLELILAVIKSVVPPKRIHLSHWDIGLAAVGVGGITVGERNRMLTALKHESQSQGTWDWGNSFDRQTLVSLIFAIWDLRPGHGEPPTWPEIDKL